MSDVIGGIALLTLLIFLGERWSRRRERSTTKHFNVDSADLVQVLKEEVRKP